VDNGLIIEVEEEGFFTDLLRDNDLDQFLNEEDNIAFERRRNDSRKTNKRNSEKIILPKKFD
jgi:hypothetical protein